MPVANCALLRLRTPLAAHSPYAREPPAMLMTATSPPSRHKKMIIEAENSSAMMVNALLTALIGPAPVFSA